jgi:tetratricopeptide (TPR) repeat protein
MAQTKRTRKRYKNPQRPMQHRLEEISKRAFESVLPDTWTYEPKTQREYGIDGVVELFDGDDTTGLRFNIQLKGVEKSPANKALIKTTTRNYWKDLDTPTLVVLVDGDRAVHYGWSHQFDPWGRKKDAASYQWVLPGLWGETTVVEIEREVKAARAALHLAKNLPIYWSVAADTSLRASWAASFQVSLERLLAGSNELTRRAEQSQSATLEVSIQPDAISVRLHGTPGGTLHYRSLRVDELEASAMAADVALGLAVELERGGLAEVVADLLALAVPESSMIGDNAELTTFAATCLAKAGRADPTVGLVDRVYSSSPNAFGELVTMAISKNPGRLDTTALARIGETIASHAASAEDGPAAASYHNAASLIRRFDAARALELHDLAAERNPNYRGWEHWWRERGQMLFSIGDLDQALIAYVEADRLGDVEAAPLLADTLAMTGSYTEAIEVWDRTRDETRVIWSLKRWSLQLLIDELSISGQARDQAAASALFADNKPGLDVLAADALHVGGLWRAAAQRRESGKPGFLPFHVAAAAFAVNDPMLWFEAMVAIEQEIDDAEEMGRARARVIVSAVQECGDDFRHFVIEDQFVPDGSRAELLKLIDIATLPKRDVLVVREKGKIVHSL